MTLRAVPPLPVVEPEQDGRVLCPGNDGYCDGTPLERSEAAPQRRENVRIDLAAEVHIGRAGQQLHRCRSVDISGSGLRAAVSQLVDLQVGEEVDVYLRMADGFEIEARAVVVRSSEESLSAFRFLDLDPYLRELLIRQIFAGQRRTLTRTRRP